MNKVGVLRNIFWADQMYILRNILAFIIKKSSRELVLSLKEKKSFNNKYFTKLSKLDLKH